jgi:hypothetical protein
LTTERFKKEHEREINLLHPCIAAPIGLVFLAESSWFAGIEDLWD